MYKALKRLVMVQRRKQNKQKTFQLAWQPKIKKEKKIRSDSIKPKIIIETIVIKK